VNPAYAAVKRQAEEDWGGDHRDHSDLAEQLILKRASASALPANGAFYLCLLRAAAMSSLARIALSMAAISRTHNPLERILREIRRRARVVGAFPDGQSALNFAAVPTAIFQFG
jgi:hypothetical protein